MVQSHPVNMDTEGAIESVCIKGVSTLGVGGGGWLHRILSDRDDQRIFWGLEFSISGFFWVGKFWQVFFWVA